MTINVKPADKKIYIENLVAANFKFTTVEKSKIVAVEVDSMDEIIRLLDVKEE